MSQVRVNDAVMDVVYENTESEKRSVLSQIHHHVPREDCTTPMRKSNYKSWRCPACKR